MKSSLIRLDREYDKKFCNKQLRLDLRTGVSYYIIQKSMYTVNTFLRQESENDKGNLCKEINYKKRKSVD